MFFLPDCSSVPVNDNFPFPSSISPFHPHLSSLLGKACEWNHTIFQYVSFLVLVISLNIMPSRFSHVVACIRSSFYLRPSNLPLHIPLSLDPFICQWAFELFPPFGHCEEHCEYWCKDM